MLSRKKYHNFNGFSCLQWDSCASYWVCGYVCHQDEYKYNSHVHSDSHGYVSCRFCRIYRRKDQNHPWKLVKFAHSNEIFIVAFSHKLHLSCCGDYLQLLVILQLFVSITKVIWNNEASYGAFFSGTMMSSAFLTAFVARQNQIEILAWDKRDLSIVSRCWILINHRRYREWVFFLRVRRFS